MVGAVDVPRVHSHKGDVGRVTSERNERLRVRRWRWLPTLRILDGEDTLDVAVQTVGCEQRLGALPSSIGQGNDRQAGTGELR